MKTYTAKETAQTRAAMAKIAGQMRAAVDRERLTSEQARLRMRSRVKARHTIYR